MFQQTHLFFYGEAIKYVTLFLANFDPPSLCHTLSHIPGPLKKYVTHIGPHTQFLVGLVLKARTKDPYTNSLSIVGGGFCFGVLSFVWKVLSGVVLSVPPSVRLHLFQQNVKHHFKFHVSHV